MGERDKIEKLKVKINELEKEQKEIVIDFKKQLEFYDQLFDLIVIFLEEKGICEHDEFWHWIDTLNKDEENKVKK